MQTAQTECALVFNPYRLFVFDFNRLYRTLLCAQTASYTGILHIKVLSFSLRIKKRIGKNLNSKRFLVLHQISSTFLADFFKYRIDVFLSLIVLLLTF